MKITTLVIKAFIVLMIACVSYGCEVIFLNPLPNSKSTPLDKQLIGKWIKTDEKTNDAYLQFDASPKGEINISFFGDGNTEKNPVFTGFTTKIGKHYYLNLSPTDEHRGEGFVIARYAISGDKMTVWVFDSDKMKAVVAKGKLKGQAQTGSLGGVTISDSAENIAALLESPGSDDLFELFGVFEKAKSK